MKILNLSIHSSQEEEFAEVLVEEKEVEECAFRKECCRLVIGGEVYVTRFHFKDISMLVWGAKESMLDSLPSHGFLLKDQFNKELRILGDVILTGVPLDGGKLQSAPLTPEGLEQLLRPHTEDDPCLVPLRAQSVTLH